VQARVISRHLSGESKREIARAESIGRDTVGRILSQEETVQMIARQRSRLQSMADKALDVVERALTCDDARLAVAVAMKIIEHVFPKCCVGDTANSPPKLSPEVEEKDRRLLILAQIIGDDFERRRMYDLPLPPDLERVRDELERIDAQEQTLQLPTRP
jgi:hypothetical protein